MKYSVRVPDVELLTLFNNGFTVQDIASRGNVHINTVYTRLRKLGIKFRKSDYIQNDKAIKKLANETICIRDICNKLNLPYSKVRHSLKRQNLKCARAPYTRSAKQGLSLSQIIVAALMSSRFANCNSIAKKYNVSRELVSLIASKIKLSGYPIKLKKE